MEGGRRSFLFYMKALPSWPHVGQMLESQAGVGTFPHPQFPVCRPLVHISTLTGGRGSQPPVQPIVPEQGLASGDDSSCTVTPCTSSLPATPGHSVSVLIVFIHRHKYEWNFNHHPDSFLVPKCSLLHLHGWFRCLFCFLCSVVFLSMPNHWAWRAEVFLDCVLEEPSLGGCFEKLEQGTAIKNLGSSLQPAGV